MQNTIQMYLAQMLKMHVLLCVEREIAFFLVILAIRCTYVFIKVLFTTLLLLIDIFLGYGTIIYNTPALSCQKRVF